MAKEEAIKVTGKIEEVLPNTTFRVKLENNHVITATISGKLRQNNIRIGMGDTVELEFSPYDLNRGRIVYRNK